MMSNIVSVSLGKYHSAAITMDGDLYMWGYNYYGQVGDGTKSDSSVPVKVMSNVASVCLGYYHSAAITTDGDLYMWGRNGYGQLGDGTTTSSSTPIKVMSNVASVSLGEYHSAAITIGGELYTWGYNSSGQLGDGTYRDRTKPARVMADVSFVSLGSSHSAAITTDGDLYTWGNNFNGALGDGTTTNRWTPVKVMSNVASASLGHYHSAAITTDGDLYTWGSNSFGQLGDGTTTVRYTPVKVMSGVAIVSLGHYGSSAITAGGALYAWGSNSFGRLGDGSYQDSTKPARVMSNVVSVSLGNSHSVAIMGNEPSFVGQTIEREEGSYQYVASLSDKDNYIWSDGTSESKTITWNIKKKTISIPSQGQTLYYTGEVADISETWGINPGYHVSSGISTASESGEYSCIVSLDYPELTQWEDGAISDKVVSWCIKKQTIELEVVESCVYNGSSRSAIQPGNRYSLTGDVSKIDVGEYSVTATLNDSNLYTWADGTTEPKTYEWKITPKAVEEPEVATGFEYDGQKKAAVGSYEGVSLGGVVSAVNAGDYRVTCTPLPNYCWADGTTEAKTYAWSISKKPVDLSVGSLDLGYNGENHAPIAEAAGLILTGVSNATDADAYEVTCSLASDNYVWADGTTEPKIYEWKITPKAVEEPEVATEFEYDGQEKIAAHTYEGVSLGGVASAVDAGDYQVTCTPLPNYCWSDGATETKTYEWKIIPKAIKDPEMTTEFEYDGQEKIAVHTYEGVSLGGVASAVDAGDYQVACTPLPNYCWSDGTSETKTYTWSISKKPVDLSVDSLDFEYDGESHAPIANTAGLILTGVSNAADTGTYEVTCSLASSNYVWADGTSEPKTIEWTISPCEIKAEDVSEVKDQIFTGSAIEPEVVVSHAGTTLIEGRDYDVEYIANVALGTAAIKITAKGNYTGVIEVPFEINRDFTKAVVSASNLYQMATGEAISPNSSATVNGNSLQLGADYILKYEDAQGNVTTEVSEPGEYKLTAEGIGDWAGTKDLGTFTILDSSALRPGAMYRIQSAADDSLILDVAGAQPDSGANVSIWSNNGGSNQVFKLEMTDDGYVVFRNVANSDLVLDAAGAIPSKGSNVSTWTYNGGMNQKWLLETNSDGSVTFHSSANWGLTLDAEGSRVSSGANVRVWSDNDSANQKWNLLDASDVSGAEVSATGMARMCSGAALSAQVGVTLNGATLTEGTDYEVYYEGVSGTSYEKSTEAPSSAGQYSVSIQGTGGFIGSKAVGAMKIYAASSVKADGTRYHIRSYADPDFVLDVANAEPVLGSNVSVWTDNSGANQLFTFELGSDGYYVIRNAANTNLVLDAAGAEPELGANVSTWSENGGMNQKWVIIPPDSGSGEMLIASAYDPSFVLDAAGAQPSIGANVSVWTANGGKNQLWTFVDAMDISDADVSATGLSRMECGKALEVEVAASINGIELGEGADFELYYKGVDGTSYEKSTDAPSEAGAYMVTLEACGLYYGTYTVGTMHIYAPDTVKTGGVKYRIHSAVDSTFVLDVEYAKPVMGSNVSVWTSNGGDNQLFTFELGDDGYYVMRNVANTALVLDASGSKPEIGANVSTWTENGGKNQKWVLVPQSDGTIVIQSAFDPTFVLDAAGKRPTIGANVSIWTDNGGANQHWNFEEVAK